jgi:hypothetical protein
MGMNIKDPLVDAMAPEAPLQFKGADDGVSKLNYMRTTLELPVPLFTLLKARAASERVTLKQLLRSYVEQGLSAAPECAGLPRSAATVPRLNGPLAIEDHQLSNAALFELLDPCGPPPTCRI